MLGHLLCCIGSFRQRPAIIHTVFKTPGSGNQSLFGMVIRSLDRGVQAFCSPKAFIFRTDKKSQKKANEYVVCKIKRVVYLHPASEVAKAAESKEKRSCTDQKKKGKIFRNKVLRIKKEVVCLQPQKTATFRAESSLK
jgi:hypothetical protein